MATRNTRRDSLSYADLREDFAELHPPPSHYRAMLCPRDSITIDEPGKVIATTLISSASADSELRDPLRKENAGTAAVAVPASIGSPENSLLLDRHGPVDLGRRIGIVRSRGIYDAPSQRPIGEVPEDRPICCVFLDSLARIMGLRAGGQTHGKLESAADLHRLLHQSIRIGRFLFLVLEHGPNH